jgi:cell division transport system ATP-binding protein
MIELYHVAKAYDGRTALADVSFSVDKGEFVFVTGPSGAGKTTLFKLLFREELPTQGHVVIDGQNLARLTAHEVARLRRKIGVVFQDFRLLELKTVLENVAFVLKVIGVDRAERKARATRALRQVGLEHKLHDRPSRLSGGEKQRVAIARALVSDPLLLLADEPTGNLDPDLAREIMAMFDRANARGTTVVVATHDRELMARFPRRVLTLEDGRVTEERAPAAAPALR